MKKKISILDFFVRNYDNKSYCREVYFLLQDCGISLVNEFKSTEILGEYYEFIEYILFEPELHASNYPVPELHDDIIPAFVKYINDFKNR